MLESYEKYFLNDNDVLKCVWNFNVILECEFHCELNFDFYYELDLNCDCELNCDCKLKCELCNLIAKSKRNAFKMFLIDFWNFVVQFSMQIT